MMNHASRINIGSVNPPEKINAGIQSENTRAPRNGRPAKAIDNGGRRIAKI
jgi:hypothetical protein